MKKNILFIINPVSGNQHAPSLCKRIYDKLDKNKFSLTISFTGAKGEGALLAQKAIRDRVDYVIAVGGDGTVNEIGSELVHSDVVMGIIPNGSGDGLARHLRLRGNFEEAMEVINQEHVVPVDYCLANDVKFFCTFGMGFDALISYVFSKAGTRGFSTYVEKVFKEYINYKPEEYVIECNGKRIVSKSFLITCANASQWGNNAYIAPMASIHDGLLDVVTMEPFGFTNAGPIAFQLFTKTITSRHDIKMYRAKEFIFHRQTPGIYHYDGEPIEMGDTVVVRVVPAGLKMLAPKNLAI
ncbi:MAG: YegS/Rv2252/BmrU family lipid kinase [Bacteroidales bacterium]|nr:YegS/Rv2252/BmrU family lipid kinase [Bacteroidales bacterium]